MNNEFFQRMHERDQSQTPVNEALKAKLARELKLGRSPSWFNRMSDWFRTQARPIGGFALASALVLALSLGMSKNGSLPAVFQSGPVTDDWQYNEGVTDAEQQIQATGLSSTQQSAGIASGGNPFAKVFNQGSSPTSIAAPAPSAMMAPSMAYESVADSSLGFSVGGAKDIANFRENIKNGFLPLETDVTYEGLFYDYSFDTGQRQTCNDLFCPSYARALVRNPLTGQEETYLSVGLNSNIKESDFKRQKTNFVVVLDISGSMSSPFDRYYYDSQGNRIEAPQIEAGKTKMQLANESLSALVDQLNPDDRLGIVLFSDGATVAKPLRLVGETDRTALKRHIMEIQATNGTNMSAGLEEGMKLFRGSDEISKMYSLTEGHARQVDGYTDRMIFITDAMPNQGEFGARGLHGLIEDNAKQGVQTTLLGVGVDFQTDLVEALTKVRGANYLSIHSSQEFKKRLGEEFDFLVSPLVYDLRLDVKGSGYAIDEIYGSPDADLSSGEVLHVRTLFPSKTENGETKGGLVLLKLRKTGEAGTLNLRASYEDTAGKKFTNESVVSFGGMAVGVSDNQGIRKGVLLAQYAKLLKSWIQDERGGRDPMYPSATNWERASRTLQVSDRHRTQFEKFTEYFTSEVKVIGDKTLEKEQEVLNRLTKRTVGILEPSAVSSGTATDDWRY